LKEFVVVFVIAIFCVVLDFQDAVAQDKVDIVIKIDENYQAYGQAGERLLDLNQQQQIQKVSSLKYLRSAASAINQNKSKYLDGIYKIEVEIEVPISEYLADLEKFDNVIYAEAIAREKLLAVPNDPLNGSQDYLTVINAYQAWDVTTGSEDIVIAISDNGVDLDHDDLEGTLYENTADIPDNGLDDDGNGYIDDNMGYDLADDDNMPTDEISNHGSLVAGIAGAHTNNGVGISGVGYDSKIYSLKVFQTADGLSNGTYESIIYAADMDFDVINLSWGSVGTFSQFSQDVINYAVLEKNMVVVAAAGNTVAELDFYPASYDHVLSVGATDIDDNLASFATYSYNIDLMAPGNFVYSTARFNGYASEPGSSFSAPQVSGAAALVKTVFPQLDAIQIMEQLRVTADDIYGVGNNSDFLGQLGNGRLNVLEAVSNNTTPALRALNSQISSAFGVHYFFRDTVSVTMDFVNFLRTISGGEVNISTLSPYAQILNTTVDLGMLSAYDSLTGVIIPILLDDATPASERLIFRMDYQDENGYVDFEYFEFTTAPFFLDMANGDVELTISANGRLGYQMDTLENGVGLKYNNMRVANFLGIMIGNEPDSISDNVINDYTNFTFSDDFQPHTTLRYFDQAGVDQYARNIFSDSLADNINGLLVEQEFFNWTDGDNDDFMITEYYVSNISGKDKSDMRLGLYADFNVADSSQNFVAWDATNQLAYTYSNVIGSTMAGLALLSSQPVFLNAIDLFDSNGVAIDIDPDFNDQLKYDFLNTEKTTAGGVDGNDVAQLLSVDLGELDSAASEKVAFAWVFGGSLSELVQNVDAAKVRYSEFLLMPSTELTVSACPLLDVLVGNAIAMTIFSDVEESNEVFSGTSLNLGSYDKDTLFYFRYENEYTSDLYRLDVTIMDPMASFSVDPDTLFLGDDPVNAIQFTDLSKDAIAWNWDFDNGSSATVQNPKVVYSQEGEYAVTMQVSSFNACMDAVTRNILVATRSVAPIIDDQVICAGTSTQISAANSTVLRFYLEESDNDPVFEGATLVTGNISQDTSFYVSSVANNFESHKVLVNILVDDITAGFSHRPDTLDLSGSQIIAFQDQSVNSDQIEWFADNVSIGSDGLATHDYTGLAALDAKQVVTSALGCLDSLLSTIAFAESELPEVSDQLICNWDLVQISPGEGLYFVYYSDADLTNIVRKGTDTVFGPITSDTAFYITNVSNYLESEPTEISINVVLFDPQIDADPDSLVLASSPNVTFSTFEPEVISWQWYINGQLVEIDSSPTLAFDSLGNYLVQLVSENSTGCVDTSDLVYSVYAITGINDQLSRLIKVFPNPVDDFLTIEVSGNRGIENLRMYNTAGMEIPFKSSKTGNVRLISAAHLTKGLYLMTGEVADQPLQFKFLKK